VARIGRLASHSEFLSIVHRSPLCARPRRASPGE